MQVKEPVIFTSRIFKGTLKGTQKQKARTQIDGTDHLHGTLNSEQSK